MFNGSRKKSTYDIWQNWAMVLERQLKRCVAVYEDHREDTGKAQGFLDRMELFIDPVSHAQELAKKNYDVKGGVGQLHILSLTVLQKIFRDVLNIFPSISEDMQRLLDSPCFGNCSGRLAMDIFKGSHRTMHEGIGSGSFDEYGTLPWMLARLLDEAEMGGSTYFEQGLHKGGSLDQAVLDEGQPSLERKDSSYKPRKKEALTGIS